MKHGDNPDIDAALGYTLDEFIWWEKRGYCLVCQTPMRDGECHCTSWGREAQTWE